MEKRTLYYHGNIVTGRQDLPYLSGGYLLTEGSRIVRVGVCPDAELPAAEVRHNLAGAIVAPGMISAHCHFYGQFVRGMSLRQPVENWQQVLSRMWWKVDKALDARQVYYCTMMGLIEGLKAGTTTYFDHHASPNFISGSLDVIEEAMRTTGGRGCLAYEVTDRDGKERAQQGIDENIRFLQKHTQPDDRFRGLFGLHASYTLEEDTLAQCSEAGRRLDAGFHIHLAEAEADVSDGYKRFDLHVAQRLEQAGILNSKTITAHNVHLRQPQFDILRRTGVTAAHNCQSNTNNAVGISPVTELLDAGVHVALGGDGYTYDLFAELGFASIVQHLRTMDCAAFPAGQVLAMAYDNNQRLARNVFGYEVGLLCEDAAADFLILDYDPPTPMHGGNLLSHMTSGFSGHVHTVVCDGQTVVQNHAMTRVDEKEVFAHCREQAQRLWDQIG